jgi:hypothetical protein
MEIRNAAVLTGVSRPPGMAVMPHPPQSRGRSFMANCLPLGAARQSRTFGLRQLTSPFSKATFSSVIQWPQIIPVSDNSSNLWLYGRICGSKWPSRRTGPLLSDGTEWRTTPLAAGKDEFFALDHGLQGHPREPDRVVTACRRAFSGRFGPQTGRFPSSAASVYPQILLRRRIYIDQARVGK